MSLIVGLPAVRLELIKKDTYLAAAKQNSNSAAGMTKRAGQK